MQRLTIRVPSSKVYLFLKALCILGIVSWSGAQPLPPPIPTPGEQSEPEQHPTTQDTQTRQSNQQPPEEPIPMVKQPEAPQNNAKANEARQNPTHTTTPDWITWLTAALVFVGVMQFSAMCVQAYYMRRGLRVTQQAADAATRSAEVAVQALHLSERAYIAIVHADVVPDGTSHEAPWHITLTIMNVGHTLATMLEIWLDYLSVFHLPEPPSLQHSTQLEPLPPTGQRVLKGPSVAMPLPPGTVLWIYGKITYADVFGNSHTNGFCMRCEFQPLPQLFPYYDARYVYET
jgi:hypothetical protein